MEKEIGFLIAGGIIGYAGSIVQHFLESRRKRISEIRQEKIRVYSNVLSELGGLFLNPEKLSKDLVDPLYSFKFGNRLGRLLGPARLIASSPLDEKLRDLYSDETAFHDYWSRNTKQGKNDEWNKLADKATASRKTVEQEMRKELKK